MPNAAPAMSSVVCEESYDRHEYHAEKKFVYEKLAGLIDRIINPVDNATTMGR
jgi:hypothetical protein